MEHAFPRGDQIGQHSASTETTLTLLQQRCLAGARGAAPTSLGRCCPTAGARPASLPGWTRFASGRPAPTCLKPSGNARWDFAYQPDKSGISQLQGFPGQLVGALRAFWPVQVELSQVSTTIRIGASRSLASHLRFPRPVRRPSLGSRDHGFPSRDRMNGRRMARPLHPQRSKQ